MRRGRNASRLAELKTEVELLKTSAQNVALDLRRLGKERADEPLQVRREREALRRKRAALLIELDNLIRSMSQKSSNKRRIVQGPKSGVRSVVRGGLPGSGKCA